MTIHSEHPFQAAPADRDPVRRLRGRLGGTVSLWTTGTGTERAGLTISSRMVATGDPGHALALLDPEATFTSALERNRTCVMQLLHWPHRSIADAFAGVGPAPGGPFRLGAWIDTEWGPRLTDVNAWAGLRLVEGELRPVGWSVLADTLIEHVELGEASESLVHLRGRYQRPPSA